MLILEEYDFYRIVGHMEYMPYWNQEAEDSLYMLGFDTNPDALNRYIDATHFVFKPKKDVEIIDQNGELHLKLADEDDKPNSTDEFVSEPFNPNYN